MNFDFTSIMDRAGMDAIAVDLVQRGQFAATPKEGFDIIPMWVADMNFPAPSCITNAIIQRVEHPAFGYFAPSDAYHQSIIDWHARRKGVSDLKEEHIGYENGVLGGVNTALSALCARGEHILVHSPTYIGFTSVLTNSGYRIVHSPLVQDAAGIYRMDYADMEEKIRKHHIHTAIFCSPHNPCGRVWEREELEAAMALFQKHDVTVISDEIWSDLVLCDRPHIPTQSISEDAKNRTVALYAPSKTFNLAGLVGSYRVIYQERLRHRIEKEASLSHYNNMNVLSMHALIGAYSREGEAWVDALREVLRANMDFACAYIKEHFPGINVTKPEGTYMLFLDCTQYCRAQNRSLDELLQSAWEVGVIWQDGRPFHGDCHIRMNLALPTARIQEAFTRLHKYVF